MSDFKKILGLVGAAAVVIVMLSFAAIWIGFHRGETGKTGQSSSGNCSILFPTSAGTDEQIAKIINKWIDQHAPSNSHFKNQGLLITQAARRSQVNPSFIVAIGRKESTFGTAGRAAKEGNNSFGRTATSGQPNIGRWYKWDSFPLSFYGDDDESVFIKRAYIDAHGQKTIYDFFMGIGSSHTHAYAPPSENDTATYIKQITEYMNEMANMGNGVVLGPACVEGTTIATTTGKLAWPLSKGTLTSGFEVPHYLTHNGIDISAGIGTPIMAADGGTVSFSGLDDTGCAEAVSIVHSSSLKTTYCHMIANSQKVKVGDKVSQGQAIGEVDSTGNSHGNHLHFMVWQNGKEVNPMNFLPSTTAITFKNGWDK